MAVVTKLEYRVFVVQGTYKVKGKLAVSMFALEGEDSTTTIDDRSYAWHCGKKRFNAGGVYMVKCSADRTQASMPSAIYKRMFGDAKLATEWQAAQMARDTVDRREHIEKRSNNAQLSALIAPLCAVYAKVPYADRAAFELWLLAAVRNGARK